MTQKTAKDAMTPISDIFSLDINSKLDEYAMLLSHILLRLMIISN